MLEKTTTFETDTGRRLAKITDQNDLISLSASSRHWEGNLFDLGLVDSMGVMFLLELIQDEFGVAIDLSMLTAELTSLSAIAAYIDDN